MVIKSMENDVAPETSEAQESLSLARFKKLESNRKEITLNSSRPLASFIELMEWTETNFSCHLKDKNSLTKLVNNRIIVDGAFLHYCEINNVSIKTLYQDSIVSWETDYGFEKFFVQGVFLISGLGVEFISAALYHKGNQNEDEISFFIIVSSQNYENYIKFRNDFDKWLTLRDRSNLHIRVIGDEDALYTRDHCWEDIFLPETIKNEIQVLVESFLKSQQFYTENKIPWKRGILLYGEPGNGKTSIIKTIISSYNFKPVTIVSNANDEAIRAAFSYAEEQSPSLLYFEDLDGLLERNINPSSFLNLMDGISAKNGLLIIATANDIGKLKTNITDRPSRFDRKFKIPLPDAKMSSLYLKYWFGNLLSIKKINELSKLSVQYGFSYAYLKELYISSMFEALSNNRKILTEKDVMKALDKLMKDKNIFKSGKSINIDRYVK
jgi:AAA+ superfamily predicted ATPase